MPIPEAQYVPQKFVFIDLSIITRAQARAVKRYAMNRDDIDIDTFRTTVGATLPKQDGTPGSGYAVIGFRGDPPPGASQLVTSGAIVQVGGRAVHDIEQARAIVARVEWGQAGQ